MFKPRYTKILCGLLCSFCTILFAAQVPSDVKLDAQQVLVRGNSAEPASLDPSLATGKIESFILHDLFETLVLYDAQGGVRPGVATHWESKDNQTYTFYLRKNSKWSDGKPVTAHDFVYGFHRTINPKTGAEYANYFELMRLKNATEIIQGKADVKTLGITAKDDHTLVIELSSPLGYLPQMLTHFTTLPLPKHVIEKYGDRWTRVENIVSNGAFKMSKWVVNERIEAQKNPMYWDAENVIIKQVHFLPVAVGSTEINRYLADDLDMTYEMPSDRFSALSRKYPEQVHATPTIGAYYYLLNLKKPPLNNTHVRRALALSIDRKLIAEKVTGRGEQPMYNIMPKNISSMTPIDPPWSTWTRDKQIEQAKRLMKEAGYGPDNPLEFTLLYNTSDLNKKVAIAISSMWQKHLGVRIKLQNQEWKTYLEVRREGDFEIARAGWYGDFNEPSTMLSNFFSSSEFNQGHYESKRFDQFILDSYAETDPQKRAVIYQKALDEMDRDMPFIPIYQYTSARMVKPYVGGYPKNPMDVIYSKDLYIAAH